MSDQDKQNDPEIGFNTLMVDDNQPEAVEDPLNSYRARRTRTNEGNVVPFGGQTRGDTTANTSETNLVGFEFEDHEVRTHVNDNQEIWFVGKDVCDCLDIGNSRDALSRLDDDERDTVAITDGTSGNPNKVVINEAGLYRLIFTSRKEEAKRFKRWIAHEVLPSIRKTGSYSVAEKTQPLTTAEIQEMSATEAFGRLVREKRDTCSRIEKLESRINTINDVLVEDVVPRRLEEQRREYLQQAGLDLDGIDELDVGTSGRSLETDLDAVEERPLPEVPIKTRIGTHVRRIAFLKYKDPREEQFQWAWSEMYRDYRNRYGTDLTVRAKRRDMSVLDYASQEGYLEDLLTVAKALREKYEDA